MARRTPLTPIFDYRYRRGAINVGNTPGSSPICIPASLAVADTEAATGTVINDPHRPATYGSNYIVLPSFSDARIVMIDVSDPTNMSVAGSVQDTTDLLSVRSVAVRGDYAYAGANQRLAVVDISTPAAPTVVGVLSDAAIANPEGIAFNGNYAYLAAGSTARCSVVDISTPTAPTLVGSVQDLTRLDFCTSIVYSGGYCFLTEFNNNYLTVVDVSTPASPTVAGWVTDAQLGGAYHSVLDGNYLYVSCYSADRLTVVDISTPTSPTIAGSVTDASVLNGAIHSVQDGNYLYLSCYDGNRVTVVDVSTPASPTLSINGGGGVSVADATNLLGAWGICKVGNYVFTPAFLNDRLTSVAITCS